MPDVSSDLTPQTTTAKTTVDNPQTPVVVPSVGIVGGSGYTGALLAELLLRHSSVRLTHVSSESLRGQSVHAQLPRVRTSLEFCAAADVTGVDLAFVCLPHLEAARVVKRLLDEGTRVVDLSADYRLSAETYAEWYGPHPHPELTPGVYGLTEFNRDAIAVARLVANPGCYPTAALLALAPLRHLGLVDVIVDAKSGVSGAGKSPKARTHFCAVDSDLMPYGIAAHRHQPEIAAGLDAATSLTFVPHLVPLQRGITETIYVRAGSVPTGEELLALYRAAYAGERFVEVCDSVPELKEVAYTNMCRLHATVDRRAGRIILVSVIDNLMKGAAGQALQNMNVMLGLPEYEGLL
ncbi:MAG: N-acetyl-gamma-glutamyl-phosphate reductase [Thermoleophilia bacterium]